MSDTHQYTIQSLDPSKHQRDCFYCESAELTEFLRKRARKEMEARISACFVIVPVDQPAKIAGFYTLSAAEISLSKMPETMIRRLPRYPTLPATLLGRLARDSSFRGKGIGDRLLVDALARSLAGASEIGSIGVVTDPKDAFAANLYAEFGFMPLSGGRLFLPMTEIARLF